MTQQKTATQKLLSNPFDGKEIIDSLGRKIRLKKPDVVDNYDLMKALGDDAKNEMCLSYALPLMYVSSIDGEIIDAPKIYSEFRWLLKKVGEEGREAVIKHMNETSSPTSDQGEAEEIKK